MHGICSLMHEKSTFWHVQWCSLMCEKHEHLFWHVQWCVKYVHWYIKSIQEICHVYWCVKYACLCMKSVAESVCFSADNPFSANLNQLQVFNERPIKNILPGYQGKQWRALCTNCWLESRCNAKISKYRTRTSVILEFKHEWFVQRDNCYL